MTFNISAVAIDRPLPSIVVIVALCVLGLFSFFALPIGRVPNVDVPMVTVSIDRPGSAPEEMETDVARIVESAVAGTVGIRHYTSTITDGRSVTTAEFRIGVPSDRALDDVRTAIDGARDELPADIETPLVAKLDIEAQVLQTWALSAPNLSPEAQSWFVDDEVTRRLKALPGVGDVIRVGGADREITVALVPERLAALGLSATDVNSALTGTQADLPGGRARSGDAEEAVRTLARGSSATDIAATRLSLSGGGSVAIGDIARVTDGGGEQRGFARVDGVRSVTAFSVYRARGADEVEVAKRVNAVLADIERGRPDIRFELVDETVSATEKTFEAAISALVEGALLAVVVVFLFLRDWRATLVAAAALPLSILPTFWVLDLAGYTLNIITLVGLTLVTGILVDDAIVEIENIVRYMRRGMTPLAASKAATGDIGLAVAAISLTIAAVFVPVSFMGGIGGQYFKEFGLTVATAVLFSLGVARLITPVMTAFLLRPSDGRDEKRGRFSVAYEKLLSWTIRRRGLVALVSLAVFLLSVVVMVQLPNSFVPVDDAGRIVLALEGSPGILVDDLIERTDMVASRMRAIPEIERTFIIGGRSPGGVVDTRLATLIVRLVPAEARKRGQLETQDDIVARAMDVPDIRLWPLNDNGGRMVAVSVASSDRDGLDRSVGTVIDVMRREPNLTNVSANAGIRRTEIHIRPRDDAAARLGISTAMLATAVRVSTIGDVDTNLAKMATPSRLIPVRVRVDDDVRADLARLAVLPVGRLDDRVIPLAALADIDLGGGASTIERYDGQRRVLVGADLNGDATLGSAIAAVLGSDEVRRLPGNVTVSPSGDGEYQEEMFAGFGIALGQGVLLMFAVLILLFGGLRLPLLVVMSLPLSLTGAFLALVLTATPVDMPVAIGILMLFGIVAKNAIMLLDKARKNVDKDGVALREAIIGACLVRARPILMTTVAMIAGMVPSILDIGGGAAFRAPMAIVVIGGLSVSTLLTLVSIPALDLLTLDVLHRLRALATRQPR